MTPSDPADLRPNVTPPLPDGEPDLDADDDYSLDLDDQYLDALLLDDEYDPAPEAGDFWIDCDAA